MGWFEKFTVCCVVIVIASLSCMLIATVQLLHRLEDVINRENYALLDQFQTLRQREVQPGNETGPGVDYTQASPDPLLAIIIRSAKGNLLLRKTIRKTWARITPDSCRGVVRKFVLVGGGSTGQRAENLTTKMRRVMRRRGMIENVRYFLFVDDRFFVNTRFVLDSIERALPTAEFILCGSHSVTHHHTPQQRRHPSGVVCDTSLPVLVSADVVRNFSTSGLPAVRHGKWLYLSLRDTEAILDQHMIDATRLAYFFTAALDRLPKSSATKPTLSSVVERLWAATNGTSTTIEC